MLYQIRKTYYYSVVHAIMEHLREELDDNNDSVEGETGAGFGNTNQLRNILEIQLYLGQ